MKIIMFLILILVNCHFIYPKSKKTTSKDNKPACRFPKLEPWTDEIRYLVKWPKKLDCTEHYPLLFRSNVTSIIPENFGAFERNKIESCCYRPVLRVVGNDSGFAMSPNCFNLPLTRATIIPPRPGYEFLSIECLTNGNSTPAIMDFHVFPMESVIRYAAEHRVNPKIKLRDKVNVFVFMFDSVSRMNFHRVMPKSYKFLMHSISAVEMKGYNKIGLNTRFNLLPMWTGKSYDEFADSCRPSGNKRIDDCHYIWKNFSEAGYMTSYSSDFNFPFHNHPFYGFIYPPVNFYMRHISVAMNYYIGREKRSWYELCAGPRIWFRILLETLQKLLAIKEYMPFPIHHMSLIGGLGHDDIPHLSFGDDLFLSFLRWFRRSTYFKNTVIIMLADHGLEYAEQSNTMRGFWEKNLPMLYIFLPSSFKNKYKRAFSNLKLNENRLVSPFDIYETLASLANLEKLQDKEIRRQEGQLKNAEKIPRGINLFLPVPLSRTCDTAEIDPEWCSCISNWRLQVPLKSPAVLLMANKILVQINSQLDLGNCSKLQINRILYAFRDSESTMTKVGYKVGIETVPGYGQFEAVLRELDNGAMEICNENRTFRINPISREMSKCKRYDPIEEKFCHCLNQ